MTDQLTECFIYRKLPLDVKVPENVLPNGMPLLFMLREDGLLCPFYVLNFAQGAANVSYFPVPTNLA